MGLLARALKQTEYLQASSTPYRERRAQTAWTAVAPAGAGETRLGNRQA
jgi:hypothetical protein